MGNQVAANDVWTATSLGLIAICAVLALLVIWWGARLKRQRRAVDQAIEDRAEEAAPAPLADAALDDIAPAAPETEPLPVAPAPPPLADAPVVATPAPVTPEPVPVADPTPTATDDLTLLKGVGPKLATRLNELGVTSFAQVAALSPADAEALDAQLGTFQGRMARDRWVEQAGYLAKDDRAGFEAAFGKL